MVRVHRFVLPFPYWFLEVSSEFLVNLRTFHTCRFRPIVVSRNYLPAIHVFHLHRKSPKCRALAPLWYSKRMNGGSVSSSEIYCLVFALDYDTSRLVFAERRGHWHSTVGGVWLWHVCVVIIL